MNTKYKIQITISAFLLFCSSALFAQNKHYFAGKMYIDTAGFVYIAKHDTVNLHGNVTSVRQPAVDKRGMLSFADSTDWKSDNESFVNGYVRSHKTGAFIFPVGQGAYRPAAISKSADAAPTDVAYYNTAQYDKNALDADIDNITDESWLIFGTTAAVITLSWSADISSLADKITNIGIAGWDGAKWVKIASAVDNVSPIFGTTSDLSTTGSISTLSEIEPNSYFAYTLAIVECPELECDVKLELTLFLEGAMRSDGTMTNYLQGPPKFVGLLDKSLPVHNPYTGMPEVYYQINDTLGPAGKVVDWILVEIIANVAETGFRVWSYDLIEKRALLLKPNGCVVDTNGMIPGFKVNDIDSVQIAVQHRNHLSILSSVRLPYDSKIKYDFSENVYQALKVPWASYQPMRLLSNGMACMWAGDIWNGASIDGTRNALNSTDYERFRSGLAKSYILGEYLFEDLNIDGMINDGDGALVNFNHRLNMQSPLLYYIKRP